MKKNLRSLIISLVLGFIIGPLLVRFVKDIPATLFYQNSITEVETGIWKIQTKEGETLYFSATEPTLYEYREMEKALGEEPLEGFAVTFYLDALNPSVNVLTKIHFRTGITVFRYGAPDPNIPENELSNYASMYEIYIEAKTITNNKTTTASLGSSGFV